MKMINIIMSVYNGEKYLAEQIDSILDSTYSAYRLFIFDDCSTDSSYKIAKEYAEKYKNRIYAYRNEENMGSTASFLYNLKRVSDKIRENSHIEITNGFNGSTRLFKRLNKKRVKRPLLRGAAEKITGIAISTVKGGAGFLKDKAFALKDKAFSLTKWGKNKSKDVVLKETKIKTDEYYMFCDQDDVWLKDKLAVTLKKMKNLELRHGKHEPSLVFTDAILVDENLKYIDRSFYRTNHMKPNKADLGNILMENKCIGCTCMFNQALCDLVGVNYEGIRYHDWWIALIGISFGNIKYLKTPTLMYRQHSGNQVGQTKFSEYLSGRLKDIGDNRRRLEETRVQAESFYHEYHGMFNKKQEKMLRCFINFDLYTPLVKRFMLIRYGFFKSGILRNIGLFISV